MGPPQSSSFCSLRTESTGTGELQLAPLEMLSVSPDLGRVHYRACCECVVLVNQRCVFPILCCSGDLASRRSPCACAARRALLSTALSPPALRTQRLRAQRSQPCPLVTGATSPCLLYTLRGFLLPSASRTLLTSHAALTNSPCYTLTSALRGAPGGLSRRARRRLAPTLAHQTRTLLLLEDRPGWILQAASRPGARHTS